MNKSLYSSILILFFLIQPVYTFDLFGVFKHHTKSPTDENTLTTIPPSTPDFDEELTTYTATTTTTPSTTTLDTTIATTTTTTTTSSEADSIEPLEEPETVLPPVTESTTPHSQIPKPTTKLPSNHHGHHFNHHFPIGSGGSSHNVGL